MSACVNHRSSFVSNITKTGKNPNGGLNKQTEQMNEWRKKLFDGILFSNQKGTGFMQ